MVSACKANPGALNMRKNALSGIFATKRNSSYDNPATTGILQSPTPIIIRLYKNLPAPWAAACMSTVVMPANESSHVTNAMTIILRNTV